jgi:hypothetical protein
VSSVTDMEAVFENTPYKGDIFGWDVSSVTNMEDMFSDSQFNGDISGWNVADSCVTTGMFDECPISEENKPIGGNPDGDNLEG